MHRAGRRGLFAAGAALAGLVGWIGLARLRAPAPGPARVPDGATVIQALPGADGQPQRWRLERREVDREALLPDALPAPDPAPRADAPDDAARALDARALESWKHGDVEGALGLFEAAVAADPDDWVAHSDYGRLLLLMNSLAEAFPHVERAAQLRPDDPRVWLDLLSLYERAQRFEAADAARRRAQELAGGRPIVRDEDTGLWRLEDAQIFP